MTFRSAGQGKYHWDPGRETVLSATEEERGKYDFRFAELGTPSFSLALLKQNPSSRRKSQVLREIFTVEIYYQKLPE